MFRSYKIACRQTGTIQIRRPKLIEQKAEFYLPPAAASSRSICWHQIPHFRNVHSDSGGVPRKTWYGHTSAQGSHTDTAMETW
uniref:Uncharacterized protein n=1 Tax=Arundo donax TaxID=35708 RepID=A0A0A9EFE2_ARUDO